MDLERRQSGLVVPKQEPKPPKRRYGPLEIQDEDKRELAAEALSKLWDAMDLSHVGSGIQMPGTSGAAATEVYYQVYNFVGELVLGEDCPVKEVLT